MVSDWINGRFFLQRKSKGSSSEKGNRMTIFLSDERVYYISLCMYPVSLE